MELDDYNLAAGGNGGDATLWTSDPTIDSSTVTVEGGYGGGSYATNGGNGGNAWVSLGGPLALTSTYQTASFAVTGGEGGDNYWEYGQGLSGSGGNASFMAGAVSMDSSILYVNAGDGYYGYGNAGTTETSGGQGWVSIGSLTMTSNNYYAGLGNGTYAYFEDYGGTGSGDNENGSANGGLGGDAVFISSGPVSLDSAGLDVEAGVADIPTAPTVAMVATEHFQWLRFNPDLDLRL